MTFPTPGRWPELVPAYGARTGDGQWWLIEGVAEIHASEADARLMAAAPALLEALKKIHQAVVDEAVCYVEVEGAEAAIAKAQGSE